MPFGVIVLSFCHFPHEYTGKNITWQENSPAVALRDAKSIRESSIELNVVHRLFGKAECVSVCNEQQFTAAAGPAQGVVARRCAGKTR